MAGLRLRHQSRIGSQAFCESNFTNVLAEMTGAKKLLILSNAALACDFG